jgi:hypothetical protein
VSYLSDQPPVENEDEDEKHQAPYIDVEGSLECYCKQHESDFDWGHALGSTLDQIRQEEEEEGQKEVSGPHRVAYTEMGGYVTVEVEDKKENRERYHRQLVTSSYQQAAYEPQGIQNQGVNHYKSAQAHKRKQQNLG